MSGDWLVSEKNKNDIADKFLASSTVACYRDIGKTQLGFKEALLTLLVGKYMISHFNSVY
jgi:hypothetical protein